MISKSDFSVFRPLLINSRRYNSKNILHHLHKHTKNHLRKIKIIKYRNIIFPYASLNDQGYIRLVKTFAMSRGKLQRTHKICIFLSDIKFCIDLIMAAYPSVQMCVCLSVVNIRLVEIFARTLVLQMGQICRRTSLRYHVNSERRCFSKPIKNLLFAPFS